MQEINGYQEALEALNKYLTPRAKTLQTLERYVAGTQYDDLDDFFSDAKPLWERAPCIVYPIVKMAIDSHADLLLGEGRFPSFTVEGTEGEEADNFEKVVARVCNLSRLKATAREVFASSQACGSACAIFSVLGGRLNIQSVYARWCTPEFDEEGAVTALEIRYPYLQIVTEPGGDKKVVCKLYRRTIDARADTEYFPVTVTTDLDPTKEPAWREASAAIHDFGFCPVVWYASLRSCSIVNEFDGVAIHRQLLDEIRAHDFALSQRHRAALYAGDPQWTEIGVRKGADPSNGGGRKAAVPSLQDALPGTKAEYGSYVTDYGPGPGAKARKKGPGVVWQYDVQDASKVKVELHSLPGDALKVIDDHARDLRGKLTEALGAVCLDAASLPNESRLSGRALTDLKAPQLARVDSYRDDFGDHFLLPALGMLMRIAIAKGIKIDGLDAVTAYSSETTWSWHAPPLHMSWGEYFELTGDEILATLQGILPAVGVLLTKRQAVTRLKDIFGIKDVDSYMTELEAEVAENDAKALKQVGAEAKATAAAKPKPAPAAKAA